MARRSRPGFASGRHAIPRGILVVAGFAGSVAVGSACGKFKSTPDAPASGDSGGPDAGSTAPDATSGCATSCPEEVATGQSAPFAIAVDKDSVYFTNKVSAGSVVRCPKTGCGTAPDVLAPDQKDPSGIALDDGSVYWTSPTEGAVRSLLKGSHATPAVVFAAPTYAPTTLLVRGGGVIWADRLAGAGGGILWCSLPCNNPLGQLFAPELVGLAWSTETTYFTGGGDNGYVEECTPSASDCNYGQSHAPYIASGPSFASPQGIEVDGDRIYVALKGAGLVIAIAKDARVAGGAPAFTTIAADQTDPFAIAVDDSYIFFTTRGTTGSSDGTVMRYEKATKILTPLAQGQGFPSWIALDDDYVYWTNTEGKQVMRVRKK